MTVKKVDGRVLGPVLAGFFIMGFCDIVAPITGRIAAEFPEGLQGAVSFLPTMVFLWFLILSTPVAALMNRIGRRATALWGYLFTFAGLLLPYAAGPGCGLGWYFAGFGLLGIGNTIVQVAVNPLLATIVPGERMTSYLTVGQIFRNTSLLLLAPIVTALVAATGSWRLLLPIYAAVHEKFDERFEGNEGKIDEIMYLVQKHVVRAWLKDEHKRVDGRGIDEIRPLNAEVDLLARAHGSGLFTRGQTQVLSVTTLGPMNDAQLLDGLDEQTEKRYIHHYNFPSYSVGETKPSRGPGRREIGHGALAEKALVPVLPSVDEFPYAIRVVSEVLSSNGSTSQGSICGSTLSLMAAGVPIKAPVAGISCGLITGDEGVYGDFMTMVDIQGLEDFYGDMDFKVAGTKNGITAIQMDLKVHGLTPEIIKEAFAKTHKARNYILDEIMLPAISEPRKELSPYAPKMYTLTIDPDKIGDVIGKGGKVIQEIQNDYDVKVNIEEDGRVFVSGIDAEKCQGAVNIIQLIATDPEVGAFYNGIVTRIMNFGAFVEIAPGKEGLVHISRLDVKRTEKVEDVVNVGDSIIVKCIEIDDQGRINLSRRDALIELEGMKPENEIDDTPKKARRDHRPRR